MSTQAESDNPASKPSFLKQFSSLGYVYWLANWMEMVERFAYYGVRIISPLFVVAAVEQGGLELSQIDKGKIWAVWAIVQSFLPILSGGFADRYGFKVNIALSTVLKIIGYFIMGYTLKIAASMSGMPLVEARADGSDHVYLVFFVGAMFLAAGTAIFKPGIQGLIANRIPSDSAALGWGLFYQMVNVGAFLGPLVAAWLRTTNTVDGVMNWENVFLVCSAAIALNFIPLFMFKEPANPGSKGGELPGPIKMLLDSIRGLLEPRIFFYTVAFAGFWLMNNQFFDILPNFIKDWVDSRQVADLLKGILGSDGVPTEDGGNLTPEWITNLNALMISLLAFLAGYITGRFRALAVIIAGITFCIVAVFCLAGSMSGWWILVCIALYSMGEMTAAPGNFRYLTQIAPPGRKGLYMGYSNFTVGIGWTLGSLLAGYLYEFTGDRSNLGRRYLVEELGADPARVEALSKADVMPLLVEKTGMDEFGVRGLLWDSYDPYRMWIVFGAIGVASLVALVIYNRCVVAADANPGHALNTKGDVLVRAFLIPIYFLMSVAALLVPSLGLGLITAFFVVMMVFAADAKHAGGLLPLVGRIGACVALLGFFILTFAPAPAAEGGLRCIDLSGIGVTGMGDPLFWPKVVAVATGLLAVVGLTARASLVLFLSSILGLVGAVLLAIQVSRHFGVGPGPSFYLIMLGFAAIFAEGVRQMKHGKESSPPN